MSFTVAIIGRPNVGKSTLFNRLVGRRVALVHDMPGVTRDRREGEGRIGDLRFTVIDTAGLDKAPGEGLDARMQAQTERAVAEADVALLVIDARAGITPLDAHFAEAVRRGPTPVILVANKCEGRAAEAGVLEAFSLGLGEPIAISAEHAEGLSELFSALLPFEEKDAAPTEDEIPIADAGSEADASGELEPGAPLQLAVVGRPNVGKSTLINRLLGEERLLTGPEPGITRDAVSVAWTHGGRAFRLIDTAGLRRKAKVTEQLEGLAAADSLRAIRFAHVAVLVIDAALGIEKQDLAIAGTVVEEGRALVIAINKWDLVRDRREVLARIAERLETSFGQVRCIRMIPVSALTGQGLDRLLPAVVEAYDVWNARIPTGPLNRWLAEVTQQHAPPMVQGRRIKLRYITQAKTRPPTFVLFASQADELPNSYRRYLITSLRDAFGLAGIPIRLLTRQGRNPYAR
jgi:GTP-binding protein